MRPHPARRPRWPRWFGALALAGCGSGVTDAELRDLRARFEASERARADLTRKVEELDNRVFLLTDQVESQKVALSRRGGEPRLPVVTLAPPAEREEPPAPQAVGPEANAEPAPEPPRPFSNEPRPKLTLNGNDVPWVGGVTEPGSTPAIGASPRPAVTPTRKARRPPPPPVRAVETRPAADTPPPVESAPPPVDADGEPTAVYRAAYGRLKAGQPEQAAEALRAFVQRFPTHDLADNAQYWLGESYYARAAYREAIPEFRAVVRRWPTGNKVPDALLKLGFCHLALGERPEGQAALDEVVQHYPRTEAAALATRRLAEIGADSRAEKNP